MITGTALFIVTGNRPSYPILGVPLYTAVSALILNLVLAIVLTPVFEAIGARCGRDITSPADYDEERAPTEPVEVGREALG